MSHFIKKCMSNTFPTMKILQHRGHATTNLFPICGLDPETIENLYQCTHRVIRDIRTASVDALRKWLEARNTDPGFAILLEKSLLFIAGDINDLSQCPNITLHPDITRIGWPSIVNGIIPTSLAHTEQTYFTHIRSKR